MFTTISALKRALLVTIDLYKDLNKSRPKTVEDVLNKAWSHIKWEKDASHYKLASSRIWSRVTRSEKALGDDKSYQRPRADP
ncbi:unnamed protein product [Cochlearia groenlandica]